jgi:LysM domain
MRSLNAHLTEASGHGRLPFHPDCPVCRATRLAGVLPAEPIVSQRAQASMVAAVLALSAGGPVAGIAAADTPAGEGTAPPQGGDGPGQQSPGFDPGGEVPLPNEITSPPAPVAGGDDDSPGGPVEDEPQEQLRTPAVGAPTTQPAAPAGPGTPTQPDAGTPGAPATPSAPAGDDKAAQPDTEESPRGRRGQARDQPTSAPAAPQPPAAAQPPAQTTTDYGTGADATDAAVRPVAAPAIPEGAASYTVRSGDSLWSIAKRLLGPNVSTAQVAREVHRLWQLNAERIGTGDPNLIMVGQTLRLRCAVAAVRTRAAR